MPKESAATSKFGKSGCFTFAALLLVMIGGLVALVLWDSDHRKTLLRVPPATTLPGLDPAEQVVLDGVLQAAGLGVKDLELMEATAEKPLEEINHPRALVVKDGHIRLLMLLDVPLTRIPASLSAWSKLEVLTLSGCGLTELPDLAGCVDLLFLDVSRNNIAQLKAEAMPVNVEWLSFGENPLEDVAPLAVLKRCKQLDLSRAKVQDFSALLDSSLEWLDLSHNPLKKMPEKAPRSDRLRVNVEGCPVVVPPGYLAEWTAPSNPADASGGQQMNEGMVGRGVFSASGKWQQVPGMSLVSLITSSQAIGAPGEMVDLEASVQEGLLRIYLNSYGDPRGTWFRRGIAVNGDRPFPSLSKVYVDVGPDKPVRLKGYLEEIEKRSLGFYVEPLDGTKVTGFSYRVWRE